MNMMSFLHHGAGMGENMGEISAVDYRMRWFSDMEGSPLAPVLIGCFRHAEMVTWVDMPPLQQSGSEPVTLDAHDYAELFNVLLNLSGYDVTSKYGTWSSSVQYNSTAYERLWCLRQWSIEMRHDDHYSDDAGQAPFSVTPLVSITREYYESKRSPWVVQKTESLGSEVFVHHGLTNMQPLLALAIFTEQNIANSGSYSETWVIYDRASATGTIHYN